MALGAKKRMARKKRTFFLAITNAKVSLSFLPANNLASFYQFPCFLITYAPFLVRNPGFSGQDKGTPKTAKNVARKNVHFSGHATN